MSRHGAVFAAVVATTLAACGGCSKPASNPDPAPTAPPADKGPKVSMDVNGSGAGSAAAAKPADGDRLRLKAEEGTLAITPPADAKAGAEATVQILVTPKTGYHVNTEFPIKLTLEPPTGVTLARTEWKAGGSSKDKGDADALDEQHLALSVKLTPSASGTYTINGSFKFAVCANDACLAKKEPIAITVAVK